MQGVGLHHSLLQPLRVDSAQIGRMMMLRMFDQRLVSAKTQHPVWVVVQIPPGLEVYLEAEQHGPALLPPFPCPSILPDDESNCQLIWTI